MEPNAYEKPLAIDMEFDEALEPFAQVNTREVEALETEVSSDEVSKAPLPFVKWVGGKRHLARDLTTRFPSNVSRYWEPFVGGGALFFAAHGMMANAHLSDIVLDLVFAYNVIKKDPEPLIEKLEAHARKHGKEHYYRVRAQHELQDPIDIAARFIYLNKTCYNGLFRVNRKGEFNVPIGRYTNPAIVQADNLRTASKALQNATIEYRQFDSIKPEEGDLVYFDPPYDPLSETSSFTGYTADNFTQADQIRLRDFVLSLHRNGIHVMISNSATDFIKSLYNNRAFKRDVVKMPRMVNSKGDKRDAVEELLITNY